MSLAHDTATVVPMARGRFSRKMVAHADWLVRQPLAVVSLATATALVVFVLATPRVLPLLGGLVALVVIGSVGPWLSLTGLRGRLSFDAERCRVGDKVTYAATMTRFGRRLARCPRVAWGTTAVSASEKAAIIPLRRGRHPTEDTRPTIESDWPFGLVTARRPGRDTSTGLYGSAGDVLGLRDYRAGDNIRSIHWAQTARLGEVVVCERPGTAAPRVRIMLQGLRRDDHAPEPCLDAAVTIASSLVESWAARGADIDVCWTSSNGESVLLCPKNRRTLDETLDALACIESVSETILDGFRQVDLEMVILIVGDARATSPREHPPAALSKQSRSNRRMLVTFEPMECPDAIVVPASPAAAVAALDKTLAEIGHDPDSKR